MGSRPKADAERLVQLVQYRWSLPVLAELFSARGSKFITLRNRLGVSRQSLQRSLAALIELGLVRRNPGYGHPMRPEYILTDAGRRLGPNCMQLVEAARSFEIETVAFQKWSLPVVHTVGAGATRFRAIQTHLPPITSRALSLALKDLHDVALVDRSVTGTYPPASIYGLTDRGEHLASLVNRLGASIA